MIEKLHALHKTWCDLTKQPLHYRAAERILFELANDGFTEDDLRCVIQSTQAWNRSHADAQIKMQFNKICGDVERFASVLAEARGKERNKIPPPTAKETVLHQWRGVTPEGNGNAKHIAEVFAEMRKATS